VQRRTALHGGGLCATLRGGGLRAASHGGGLRAALRGVGRLHAASHDGCLCAASHGSHLGGVVFTRCRAAVVFVRRCVGVWQSSSHAQGLSSRGRCLHMPSRGCCLHVAVGFVVGAVVGLAPGEVSVCPPATARARDGARGRHAKPTRLLAYAGGTGWFEGQREEASQKRNRKKRTKKTYLSHWAKAQLVVGCVLATVKAAAMWFVCTAGVDSRGLRDEGWG
jgi:hypothetical protein